MIRHLIRHRLPIPRAFDWDDFIGAAFVLALVCGALSWGG